MSRHTKEKRKIQKQKIEAQIKEEKTTFDVIALLNTVNTDTKPNMAKFLKDYVKCIGGNPSRKPIFYPTFELYINKWFVKFFDDHELILDMTQRDDKNKYILCNFLEDIDLNEKNLKLVKAFFDRLFEFKFIGDSQPRIQQKAPETPSASDCV